MGGKSSSAPSTTTTAQTDNRQVHTTDDRDVSNAWHYDLSNRSTQNYDQSDHSTDSYSYDASDRSSDSYNYDSNDNFSYDSSDRSSKNYNYDSSDRSTSSYNLDSSNRSTTTSTINWTGTDGGAVRLGELNAELMGAINESQSDGIKAMAQFGYQGLREIGESVTNIYEVAGSNASKSLAHSLDAGESIVTKLMEGAARNTDAARALASASLATYQPAEAKNADAMKYALLAGAGVVALMVFRKAA